MKVKELIHLLQNQNPESEIIFTYEGIFRKMKNENAYKGSENILIFDADYNFYKKNFENNIDEKSLEERWG